MAVKVTMDDCLLETIGKKTFDLNRLTVFLLYVTHNQCNACMYIYTGVMYLNHLFLVISDVESGPLYSTQSLDRQSSVIHLGKGE